MSAPATRKHITSVGPRRTCPVIDNRYGAGIVVGHNADGTERRVWWYSADCPVHNPPKVEAEKERQP